MKFIQSRSERVFMALIVLFFIVPLPFTILSHTPLLKKSMRMGHLNGVQLQEAYTQFSWPALIHAKYQESTSRFFDNEFFGRAYLIDVANELYFRLFRASPMRSASIFVGKNDTLYEYFYLNEYALLRRHRDELEPLVRNIKEIQDVCRSRGMGFTLLITPSKAAIYPELISEDWQRRYDQRPRAYDEFIPLLREQGVHFVDGHVITAAARDTSAVPVFPKGGIHWGDYGALLTANALIAELNSQGKTLHPLEFTDLRISNNPKGEDADLLELMNLLFPWHYPVTDLTIKPVPEQGHRPNMVIVGGSFIWKLTGLLSKSKQFSSIDCFYYYKILKKTYVDDNFNVVAQPVQSVDFGKEVFSADNLVLEINESVIPNISNHLINFTNDALKKSPASVKSKASSLSGTPAKSDQTDAGDGNPPEPR